MCKELLPDFDSAALKALEKALQGTLFELIALSLLTKQAHWNVVGARFRPVHQHLDEIHEMVDGFVDEIAERLTALGISPSGQASAVAAGAGLVELPLGFHDDKVIVAEVAARIAGVNRAVRAHMGTIEDVDTVTADLMHEVVAGLEKQLWMLRSQV